MENYNYSVGLDIGTTSVGFAIVDQTNDELIEMGVRHFEEATEASDARSKRSARRNLRRKNWRKRQLKEAFVDFGVISKEEMETNNYALYNAKNDGLIRPKDHTVYHLRSRAIREKVSLRELFLCIYNISQARGHFLLTDVDFENNKNAITFDLFRDMFYEYTEPYIAYCSSREEFEEKVLKNVFEDKFNVNDLKKAMKNLDREVCEENDVAKLTLSLLLIRGNKVDLAKINDSLVTSGSSSVNIETLKKSDDELNEFCAAAVNLYDLINIRRFLKGGEEYICDINVKKIDEYTKAHTTNSLKKDDKTGKFSHDRSVKNIENVYPNGLYLKEARAILRKQQSSYGKGVISDEFIEVIISILSARIPYYIGPLSEEAKNAWIKKEHNFKYSYDYSLKNFNSVNVYDSIREWKKRMVSHCTYLPEETAMPKGSFIGETFSIVNELNILQAIDKNGEVYHLTHKDKVKLFDDLFLKNKTVTFKDVENELGLYSYSNRSGDNQRKFNNNYSLYFSITNVLPELQFSTIGEIFTDKEKLNKLEDIILNLNLFDEESSKREYFKNPSYGYGYSEDIAKRLSKIKSKGFYSLSKKFVMDYPLNVKGESLMELLFDDNYDSFVNEQMYRINNATDRDGNRIDLASNKYENILKDKNELSIDLLIDGNKPVIPISRPVVRALNETLKVYDQIIKYYGVPKRLVIETARDFNDPDNKKKKTKTIPHHEKMYQLYDSLIKQKNDFSKIEEKWEDIEDYLVKNRDKIELYLRQNGMDLISGKKIDLNHLDNYEIDHILPAGFGDDSLDNKELIEKRLNAIKGARLPLTFIESGDALKLGVKTTTKEFVDRVKRLRSTKIGDDQYLISEKKYKMLMLDNENDISGFIEQNIVDTRYIIKEFVSIINAYNKVNSYDDIHLVTLKSAYTNIYRKGLKLKKNRDVGLQHHAIDAATIVIADACLNAMFPHYDQRKNNYEKYQNFINRVSESLRSKDGGDKDELVRMVNNGYYKAFGVYPNRSKLFEQLKNVTPLYSEKVLKNYRGQFFDQTIQKYSELKNVGKDVLSVLGVNNSEHVFTGVNCVAVDFYKITKANKKKEHVAIHIPKVIVNDKGEINREQYLSLIRDYYKVSELIDENGNLKEYYFRFRVFKNDLVYDTNSNVVQRFLLGSIANKKLELKHIDIYSYNAIYKESESLFKDLRERFDIKLSHRDIKHNRPFESIERGSLIDYVIEHCCDENEKLNYSSAVKKDDILNKAKTLEDFCLRFTYLTRWIEKPNTPPSIIGQYTPVINNREIKKNNDSEYVKLKYSILGLRFGLDRQGKLKIVGPKYHSNAFKKIRKLN